MPTFLVAHLPYIKLIGITMLPPRSRPSSCRPYELSGLAPFALFRAVLMAALMES
jgi:hypothetical protein